MNPLGESHASGVITGKYQTLMTALAPSVPRLARVGDLRTDLVFLLNKKNNGYVVRKLQLFAHSQISHSFSTARIPREATPHSRFPRGNQHWQSSACPSDIGANNTREGGSVEAGSDESTPMYRGRPCTLLGCMYNCSDGP
jgi:hypothetical protein